MRRPAIVRFRALGLMAAVLLLAASALWIGSTNGDVAVLHHPTGPIVSDLGQAVVASTAAEANVTSGWLMPLAALGAAVAVALRYFARRDVQLVRAAYQVKRRLVRAGRRAPPRSVAIHVF